MNDAIPREKRISHLKFSNSVLKSSNNLLFSIYAPYKNLRQNIFKIFGFTLPFKRL